MTPRPDLPAAMMPINRNVSRKEQAAESIRRQIVEGGLNQGQLYSVADIAAALEVSRTPVREALIELESHGLVRFERNRGVRITMPDASDLQEIAELRAWLEVPALRKAVSRIDRPGLAKLREAVDGMEKAAESGSEDGYHTFDRAFHQVILDYAGNSRLARFVEALLEQTLRSGLSVAGREMGFAELAESHRAILDAIEQRDADRATGLQAKLLHRAEPDVIQ